MQELLKLARDAIQAELMNEELKIPVQIKPAFNYSCGVFVILKKDGVERGKFGFSETVLPLWKSIPQAAKAAAINDPQFPPVNLPELHVIEIEIYLLSEHKEFTGLDFNINDTIMIINYVGEAILLPGIAKTKEEGIRLLYEKSGLGLSSQNKLYKFKTEIIRKE